MYKKIIFILIGIFFLWIWKDYKKIDFAYINQSKITYNYSNLNNIFFKKLHIFFNEKYEKYLYKNSELHYQHWLKENELERKKLPEYKFFNPSKKFTTNLKKNQNTGKNWERSHGNNTSNRFSSLKQINNKNASKVSVAWTFVSEDYADDIQANPIVIDGIIYTPIAGGYIGAINGRTGELVWKSKKFGYFVARRGLVYWKGNNLKEPRLYFSNRERLICLDARTGNLIKSFGRDGQVRTGLNVITPVINNNKIIIATWDHSIEVYNLVTGKVDWKLKYKKNNNKRVGGKKFNNSGYNPWGGISFDEEREILYITTGNPHNYFDGTLRPGKNLRSNSLIAIDINKKKILWSFQETSHDIWNSDLPAPPILTSIMKDGKSIDVVLTPTKRANTLILDRLTGEPIFKFRYRKAPVSKVRGEKTSAYQPDLEIPEPFGKNIFSKDDFWSYDSKELKVIKEKYKNHKFGFYETYELNKKNLQYNFNGGAEWMGASVDHLNQTMYVTSSNIPWETSLEQINDSDNSAPLYASIFKRALSDSGYPISKPPWGSITAINLTTGKKLWQIPFGEYKELSQKGIEITGTENFGGVTGTEGNIILATGTLDKNFYIFDSKNGKKLYSYELPFIGSAPPTTYLIDGKQFIIVHATGGKSLMQGYPDLVEFGNRIVSFSIN